MCYTRKITVKLFGTFLRILQDPGGIRLLLFIIASNIQHSEVTIKRDFQKAAIYRNINRS